jgi:anti-anti-sigma factor
MGSVRIDQEDGGPVMVLLGEIDATVVADFDPAGDGATQVVAIDASAVTFFGSAGVTLLLRYTKAIRETGRQPHLRQASRPVRRTLEVTGLLEVFNEE